MEKMENSEMEQEKLEREILRYNDPVPNISAPNKRKRLPPIEGKAQVDDILKYIFPPKKINVDDREYIQAVSSEEPNKDDIMKFANQLENKLKARQARRTGICDVRMDIYDDMFNELIRQVTINCPERGLLLMKVRDEMKVTIAANKSLYESSVIFGIRKQVEAEEGVQEMEDKIKELNKQKTILENQKLELINELGSIEAGYNEINTYEKEKIAEEIRFLELQNKDLEFFLNGAKTEDDAIMFKQKLTSEK